MRLKGKVAIVTGGGAGIGGAIVRNMASEGAIVAIGELETAAGEQALASINAVGGKGWFGQLDATNRGEVDAFVAEVISRYGQVDILANVVGGIVNRGSILDCNEQEWDETFNRNVKSTYHVSRAVVPHMLQRNYGSIINTGSAAGLAARSQLAAYSAAKGAIIALTRQMAADFGTRGIRVNCICPGPVITERSRMNYAKRPGALETRAKEQLLGRTGIPEDVGGLVVFLASDESAWITGHAYAIDGGNTAGQGLAR